MVGWTKERKCGVLVLSVRTRLVGLSHFAWGGCLISRKRTWLHAPRTTRSGNRGRSHIAVADGRHDQRARNLTEPYRSRGMGLGKTQYGKSKSVAPGSLFLLAGKRHGEVRHQFLREAIIPSPRQHGGSHVRHRQGEEQKPTPFFLRGQRTTGKRRS
jgi:hypothetical protein